MTTPLNQKILIVEDDTAVAKDLRLKLIHLGYTVVGIAATGLEAIALTAQFQPDLVLMDIVLQDEIDGIEAANTINELYKIPVVYLTAYSDQSLLERAKLTEPLGYVIKPCSEHDLNIILSMAFYKAAAERQRHEKILLAATLFSLSEALIVWDKNGTITQVNDAFATLYSADKNELLGQEITDLITLYDYRTHQPLTEKLLYLLEKDGLLSDQQDLNFLRKEGVLMPVRVSGNRIRSEQGLSFGYVLLIRDDTERKQQELALRDSEARFQQLANHIESVFYLSDIKKNKIIYINQAYETVYQKKQSSALQGQSAFLNSIHADDVNKVQQIMDTVQLGKTSTQNFRIVRSDSAVRWVNARCYPVYDTDTQQVYRMACVVDDITDHKKAEDKLLQASAVFENTAEGIIVTDTALTIIAVNPAFSAITGYSAQEVLGQTPRLLKSGHHDSEFYRAMWVTINQTQHWQGEVWNRRKNGEIYPQRMSISAIPDKYGKIINYVSILSDVTHIKKSQDKLDYLAHHDPLTGLANRLLFNAMLEQSIKRAERDEEKFAVLMMDLDRFKEVNDSLGHALGDELLKMVAQRLTDCVREDDTLARLGGDEFTLILQEILTLGCIIRLAEKIVAAFIKPFIIENQEIIITISIGISLYPESGDTVASLVKHADMAMYIAKEQGRNRFSFYTEDLTKNNNLRLTLATQMRLGLERGEFCLHYQPQVSLITGNIVGAEALIRWQHPQNGLMPPMQFIPLAEEIGFIDELGLWVLHEACRQCKAWQEQGLPTLTMAVNLSARQILFADIVVIVQNALTQTGLEARYLELELTESCIMQRADQVLVMLNELKAVAGSLSIDDFGTGYSSLSYLKRFPVDKLKIDRSFIKDIPDDVQDVVITRTIIGLAKNLGLTVIAEGVETEAQREFLIAEGCDEMQGYLFSRPLAADKFKQLLIQSASFKASQIFNC